jgi:hypothetical protein
LIAYEFIQGADHLTHGFFAGPASSLISCLHRHCPGAPQSVIDLETAAPGSASGTLLGYLLRPLLAPLALRAQPLSTRAKVGLAPGAAAAILGARRLARRGS